MLKKDAELSDIQKAINLSAHGHKKLMQTTLPGMNEAQLALTFMHEAAKHGISEQAYPPIIAGERGPVSYTTVRITNHFNLTHWY